MEVPVVEIEFTEEERELLLQTVLTSTYAGQLAPIVADVLSKLRGDVEV